MVKRHLLCSFQIDSQQLCGENNMFCTTSTVLLVIHSGIRKSNKCPMLNVMLCWILKMANWVTLRVKPLECF